MRILFITLANLKETMLSFYMDFGYQNNIEVGPLVTIVLATYNRSNVLNFSIRSVLAQTFRDWELWVVGDCCTDDTAELVASFKDPRIRFLNLPNNYGNQYGPNNEGMKLAKGRYVAILNHDDLWLPDHLAKSVSEIESSGADLVFTMGVIPNEDGTKRLSNASLKNQYEPYLFVPASLWLFKKELHQEIGAWKDPLTIHNVPSQDWLQRAWKAKKHLRAIPHLTAVIIQSGNRNKVYARREFQENEAYFNRVFNEPDFRENELTEIASTLYVNPRYSLKWTIVQIVKRIISLTGFNPISFYHFLLYPTRGGAVKRLKKNRGLQDHENPRLDPS